MSDSDDTGELIPVCRLTVFATPGALLVTVGTADPVEGVDGNAIRDSLIACLSPHGDFADQLDREWDGRRAARN